MDLAIHVFRFILRAAVDSEWMRYSRPLRISEGLLPVETEMLAQAVDEVENGSEKWACVLFL